MERGREGGSQRTVVGVVGGRAVPRVRIVFNHSMLVQVVITILVLRNVTDDEYDLMNDRGSGSDKGR